MVCTNVTLLYGVVPINLKASKKRGEVKIEDPEQSKANTQDPSHTSHPASPTNEGGGAEPPPEPEPEPEPQPRSVFLNSNVPCAILLHHARKCYIKEEKLAAESHGVTMETPCTKFDFALIDGDSGKVMGLGDEEALGEVAAEKLEERATYVLVLKSMEDDSEKFTPLCPKFASAALAR